MVNRKKEMQGAFAPCISFLILVLINVAMHLKKDCVSAYGKDEKVNNKVHIKVAGHYFKTDRLNSLSGKTECLG